jgi:hypothetical protein
MDGKQLATKGGQWEIIKEVDMLCQADGSLRARQWGHRGDSSLPVIQPDRREDFSLLATQPDRREDFSLLATQPDRREDFSLLATQPGRREDFGLLDTQPDPSLHHQCPKGIRRIEPRGYMLRMKTRYQEQ